MHKDDHNSPLVFAKGRNAINEKKMMQTCGLWQHAYGKLWEMSALLYDGVIYSQIARYVDSLCMCVQHMAELIQGPIKVACHAT